MGLKCCVGGCDATSETHRVFCFPKNDSLRNLWVSFVVPTNPHIIGLSKEQLLKKRVCEKHFDKHQFDEEGKRLRYSYPCLFTEDEIARGEPLLTPGAVHDVLTEHNYSKEQDDDEDLTGAVLIIGKADEDFHEHPTCSYSKAVTFQIDERAVSDQPSCSFTKRTDKHFELEYTENKPDQIINVPTHENKKSTVTQKRRGSLIDDALKSKKRKIIKQVMQIASGSLGQTDTLSSAIQCSFNNKLFQNFHLLGKQAQAFLLMQLKQCRKNKMGRRFSMEEKLIAMALMKQSPKSYKLLQNMFALPDKRTLHRLAENIIIEPGLSHTVLKFIQNKTKNWETQKKLCTIVFDEMSLSSHLTFTEKNDQINGFVDLAGERKMKYCDHALVIMIRGIMDSWRQPIAFYFCEGTTSAAALQNILKQVVSGITQIGLIPLGIVCDQGATFRAAIKKFRETTVNLRNVQGIRDDGTINIAGHAISVFYDPPHLLKGLRNNFVTKNIIWEGKTATWKDIQFIYDLDSQLGHTRALPKLTAHHVNPDKIKKMKVSVAAQVFSSRTAAMLQYTNALNKLHTGSGETSTTMKNTAEIVEFIDKLFDSVNCYPGGAKQGKLRKAVKKNSMHHQFWKEAIKTLKSIKFEDSSSKIAVQAGKSRLVRVPSLDGWIVTLESFIRISKILFEQFSVEYYYPRHINQDPLEIFFGRMRALNYRNVNPDTNSFMYSFKSLILSNFLSPHSKFSNCEVDNGDTLIDLNLLFEENDDENKENEIISTGPPQTTSQQHSFMSGAVSKYVSKDDVILEKVKVQCSAYTAGFICRRMTKSINCKLCIKTYISNSTENVHDYIKYREYKLLKNKNLAYPNSRFLILYRDASTAIHTFLNENCYKNNLSRNLKLKLNNDLNLSWLGCARHSNHLQNIFLKNVIRLHVHNWCRIINKILKGDIEEKYINKMDEPQKMAFKKYRTLKLRKKAVHK